MEKSRGGEKGKGKREKGKGKREKGKGKREKGKGVSDVHPDGRSMLPMDYPMRARYRDGFEKQHLLTPGEPVKLAWHVGFTSIIFNKGHRIRVTLASTGAPYYEPNNQTGGVQTMDWLNTSQSAINTISHDGSHPSRLVVPLRRLGVRKSWVIDA